MLSEKRNPAITITKTILETTNTGFLPTQKSAIGGTTKIVVT